MLVAYWTYRTRHGSWAIARSRDGRWHPVFDGEALGSYHTPEAALEDLAGGYTFWPSSGIDPSECGLPDELGDWTPQFRQRT